MDQAEPDSSAIHLSISHWCLIPLYPGSAILNLAWIPRAAFPNAGSDIYSTTDSEARCQGLQSWARMPLTAEEASPPIRRTCLGNIRIQRMPYAMMWASPSANTPSSSELNTFFLSVIKPTMLSGLPRATYKDC